MKFWPKTATTKQFHRLPLPLPLPLLLLRLFLSPPPSLNRHRESPFYLPHLFLSLLSSLSLSLPYPPPLFSPAARFSHRKTSKTRSALTVRRNAHRSFSVRLVSNSPRSRLLQSSCFDPLRLQELSLSLRPSELFHSANVVYKKDKKKTRDI